MPQSQVCTLHNVGKKGIDQQNLIGNRFHEIS